MSVHRARSLSVRQRTQLINDLRGMVVEFGVYIARGLARIIGFAEDILAGEVLDLPDIANDVIHNLCEHLMALHACVFQTRTAWSPFQRLHAVHFISTGATVAEAGSAKTSIIAAVPASAVI